MVIVGLGAFAVTNGFSELIWYLIPSLSPTNATMEPAHLASWPVEKNFPVATYVKKGIFFTFTDNGLHSMVLVLGCLARRYFLWCLNNLHIILHRCHGPISPPNPEFTLKPTKRKMEKQIECTPGIPCPPCKEVVLVPCFGQHLGQERAVSFC